MSGILQGGEPVQVTPAGGESHARCIACGQLWPRDAMQWAARPSGPVWFPRTVRVLRCPDCRPV